MYNEKICFQNLSQKQKGNTLSKYLVMLLCLAMRFSRVSDCLRLLPRNIAVGLLTLAGQMTGVHLLKHKSCQAKKCFYHEL